MPRVISCSALVFVLIALGILFSLRSYAQPRFSVSGTIKDALSGETLIGANVKLQEMPSAGAASNTYGFYSISAATGQYTIQISYTGFQTQTRSIVLDQNLTINIDLNPLNQLNEVVISSRPANERVTDPQMGLEKLNMESIKNVPVLFGEKDILKTIQLLPGIKSAGEGNSGFYVRGGSSDQNLILLDEANVY